jgi:hypothetical protein
MLGVPSVSVPSAPAGNTTAANATAITASAAATRPRVFDLLTIICLLLRLWTRLCLRKQSPRTWAWTPTEGRNLT